MKIIKFKNIEYIIGSTYITIYSVRKQSVLTYMYLIDIDFVDDLSKIKNAPIPDQEKIDKINKIILTKIRDLINP